MPPSAMTGTPPSRAAAALHHRGELRHADAGDDARGADGARADADLHRVGAGLDQRRAPSAVATLPATTCTALDRRLMRSIAREHAAGMAVRGVDHHDVDLGFDQRLDAREAVLADAGRGRDAQPAQRVLHRIRVGLRLVHVLDGDQADAAAASSTTSSFSMRCLCSRRAPRRARRRSRAVTRLSASSARRRGAGSWRSARRGW